MRPPRLTVRATTAVLALPLLLSACSIGTTGASPSSPDATIVSTQTTSPSPEASPTPSLPTAVIPDGYQELTAPESGVSLAVPDTWLFISSDSLDSPEAVQAMAITLGKTPDEVRQMLQTAQIDAYAEATAPDEHGFTQNANVSTAAVGALPTRTAFEMSLSQMGAGMTMGEYSRTTTPIGEAATMTYSVVVNGITAHGAMSVVEAPDGTYPTITITTGSAERSTELTEVALASLSQS